MSEDEVCPDFDIGISDGDEQDIVRSGTDTVQSDSRSETDKSVSAQQAEEPGQAESLLKLRELLVMPVGPPAIPSSSQGRRSRSRRLSRGRSIAVRRSVVRGKKSPKRSSYLCPSKISDIFGSEISPKDLCLLSELKVGSPTAVRELVPRATIAQICKMCKL